MSSPAPDISLTIANVRPSGLRAARCGTKGSVSFRGGPRRSSLAASLRWGILEHLELEAQLSAFAEFQPGNSSPHGYFGDIPVALQWTFLDSPGVELGVYGRAILPTGPSGNDLIPPTLSNGALGLEGTFLAELHPSRDLRFIFNLGVIHISALSDRRIAHPRDAVQTGQEVMVLIERLDPGEKRIGLRLWNEAEDRPVGEAAPTEKGPREARAREEGVTRPRPGQVVTGKIDRIEPYGVFVAFPGGKGLVPASETGTDRGTDMKRAFQLGQELKVSILEVDSSGKIRLSVTAAERAEEREEVEAWTKTQPKGGGMKGFGTFADLLKGRKV